MSWRGAVFDIRRGRETSARMRPMSAAVRLAACLLSGILLAGGIAPLAHAQEGCENAEHDAALDQYCEAVPGAAGDKGDPRGAAGAIDRRIGAVERQTAGRGEDRPAASGRQADRPADDVAGAVGSAIEDSGGTNGLVWILAAIAASMAALAWIVRRRRSADT